MLALISIIMIGFFLGMRHATDPDHVIAVTTIVTQQRKLGRAALIGILWGLGHTLTILLVGCAIILFNVVIPARLGLAMEFSVSLMLVLLGGWNLASFTTSLPRMQPDRTVEPPRSHSHGPLVHTHEPAAEMPASTRFQLTRPLAVGIVHGLAGSAAVALLILATIRDSRWAVAYLLVFGLGTVAGMMLITMSIASAFRVIGDRFRLFGRNLALISGVISVGFGLLLAYQIGIVQGLFGSHPHWTPR